MHDFKFDIFKEITIGGLKKDELLQKLIRAGVQFNHYAETLFNHPNFLPQPEVEKVKLVRTTLSVLGLEGTCSFDEFASQVCLKGLKFCPLYLAAFLRLEYLEQPEGPHLTIANEILESDNSYPKGFYIRKNEGELWLRGYRADGFADWPEGNEFIFIKSQSN